MIENLLLPLFIGTLSWFAWHWLGKQIVEFYEIRKEIYEQLVYVSNIWGGGSEDDLKVAIKEYDNLRRLAARLLALEKSLTCISRWWLHKIKNMDLGNAAGQLFVYDSDRTDFKDVNKLRTEARKKIEKALNLPSD